METGGVELLPTTWAKDLEVEVGEWEKGRDRNVRHWFYSVGPFIKHLAGNFVANTHENYNLHYIIIIIFYCY